MWLPDRARSQSFRSILTVRSCVPKRRTATAFLALPGTWLADQRWRSRGFVVGQQMGCAGRDVTKGGTLVSCFSPLTDSRWLTASYAGAGRSAALGCAWAISRVRVFHIVV